MRLFRLLAVASTCFFTAAFAADHIDSPNAAADPAADLNDFYVFVNPNDASEVIFALTINPFADRSTLFSDAVEYQIFLENEPGLASEIRCSFSRDQNVTCTAPGDRTVSGPTGQTNTNGDFRVWAGLRDDPFFFDFEAFNETIATATPAFNDPGVDFFAGLNVMALVVGIDREAISPQPAAKAHFNQKVWAATERVEGDGIGGGISGSWLNTDDPGQGWILEAVSNPVPDTTSKAHLPMQFVAYYFGYNNGAQLWLAGNGPDIDGNTATVEVFRGSGGQFGAAFQQEDATLESVGTMVFDFENCTDGTVSFNSTADDLVDFSLPISRLTDIAALDCNLFIGGQVDREGRAAVNTALIPSGDDKNDYNQATDPSQWATQFTDLLSASLTFVDGLDGVTGNLLTGDADTLASVLVDDRLQVDFDIPDCGSYLALEAAALGGVDPTECGGRTLEADVVDVTLTALVSGFETEVGDGVDANDKPFLDEFPFLAAPH